MITYTEGICGDGAAILKDGQPMRISEIVAELNGLRKDAERWRWLRQQGGWPETEAAMSNASPEDFDAMIDREMA